MPLNFDRNLTDISQYLALPDSEKQQIFEKLRPKQNTYSYNVQYTIPQRIGRFFEWLGLSMLKCVASNLDRRVERKWQAVSTGTVEKQVKIAHSVVDNILGLSKHLEVQAISAWQYKNYDTAEGLFRNALALSPKNLVVLCSLITVYTEHNNLKEAERLSLQSLPRDGKFEKDHVPFLCALGSIYEKKEDSKKAKEWFEKAFALNPDDEYIKEKLGK